MTFRGNLLLYSLWYELHPFENLRRSKGHHCHGLTHLSWQNAKFYRVLGKKFCGLFIYPDSQCGRLWLSQPGDRDSYGCAPGGNEQDPPQRREARFANGVAPYIPAPFAGMPGAAGRSATEAARRNGRCKPWFRVRDGSPPGRRQFRWLRSRQPARGRRKSHKQERNGKKRKRKKKNNNKHGNHRKITSEKHSGHITNGKGNGRRVSVARFPSGVNLPGRGSRRADRRPPPPALYHLFQLP